MLRPHPLWLYLTQSPPPQLKYYPLKMVTVPHLEQLVLAEGGRGVVEVQHGGRWLDDVPAAVGAAESIVSGQTEVLVAAAAVGQLKDLTGNDGLLLGHAVGGQ